jgi:branched-chain amino acid transport system permease protein
VIVWSDIVIQLLIYFILTTSLNFIIGFAKNLSIHHAALFAVGAFTYAALASRGWTAEVFVAIAAAALVGGLVSLLLALGSLRVSGDYFIVASFAFQLVAIQVLYNWDAVSGGTFGVFALPQPEVLGVTVSGTAGYIALCGGLALLTLVLSLWTQRGPYGRLVRAMGESPSALATAGFGILRIKAGIFLVSGVLATTAGVLFASYLGVAQTSSFGIELSILVAAMVIIGGSGSAVGSLLGAALIVVSQPLIDRLELSAADAAAIRQLVFAVLLIAIVVLLPRGLVQLREAGGWFRRAAPEGVR